MIRPFWTKSARSCVSATSASPSPDRQNPDLLTGGSRRSTLHTQWKYSKGGLNQLTRAMAVALAKWGIRVNAISPGTIETDMLSPLGRIGQAKRFTPMTDASR
ncbi:Glucose/ribitol dehydrogenase [Brucella sp. NF 2653]|nr:Glucose/ribitol dehydrogenase [Brucella sp. NF 2653]